uniref:Uncharacterized protein n=1 Tax=Spermophilus dauricus TaxID=99837 RepID=A0A8C9PQ82_SPEDA
MAPPLLWLLPTLEKKKRWLLELRGKFNAYPATNIKGPLFISLDLVGLDKTLVDDTGDLYFFFFYFIVGCSKHYIVHSLQN